VPTAGDHPELPPDAMAIPAAAGQRLAWTDLPAHLRAATERWLGGAITRADTQPSGFSPGVAARLGCANGRRCFVKAVGPIPNPTSPAYHRREAAIVAALPVTAPVPRLLWTLDEGDGGWIVLAFEDIEGVHPAQPWRDAELTRVLEAFAKLASVLTPSPIAARPASEVVATDLRGWHRLCAHPPAGLDAWSARHLSALAALEADAPRAIAGETLIHFDLRADNVLLTPDRVVIVDWPHAAIGAAWADLVFFAPSVGMQGGPPPSELVRRFAPARGAAARDLTAVIAAVAGFFTAQALDPPPPGLPTLRPFQAAQGVVARAWLAERLAIP
jgi:hypothetical protein